MKYSPKPSFEKKINSLLKDKKDIENFWEIIKKPAKPSIRCNTLKISAEKLRKILDGKGWRINQPFSDYPEIMVIENSLQPGELGKTKEHLLGYYYVQELSSMMPMLALKPKEEKLLDLAASPGSKTTQAAVLMNNKGTIIANDKNIGRTSILASNLEKIGVTNTIITRHDGVQLCLKLKKIGMKFDKILTDVPCSGEGNIRSNQKTLIMWNEKISRRLSKIQKKLASSALAILKPGGEMIYSTCTHSIEENEEVVEHLLDNFDIKLEKINLPLKTREGVTAKTKNCCRIYPQDNDTEGFFLCKIKKNN